MEYHKTIFFFFGFIQTISNLITVTYTNFKPFYKETTEKVKIILYSKMKMKNKIRKIKIKLGI